MHRLLLLACFIAMTSPAFGQDERPRLEDRPYRLKEDSLGIGSNIPRAVAGASIPLDRPYEEFSPEERAMLHSLYKDMKPGDEPPFPARGLKGVMREIVDLQRRVQIDAQADFGVRVDAKGQAQSIAVYRSPGDSFAKAIAYYLLNTDYKPAKCGGTPCEGEYRFRFDFRPGR